MRRPFPINYKITGLPQTIVKHETNNKTTKKQDKLKSLWLKENNKKPNMGWKNYGRNILSLDEQESKWKITNENKDEGLTENYTCFYS